MTRNLSTLRVALVLALAAGGVDVSRSQRKPPDDAVVITVSPQGDDSAAGSQDAPFRTLERAQLAVRQVNTEHDVTVQLKDGIYRLERRGAQR